MTLWHRDTRITLKHRCLHERELNLLYYLSYCSLFSVKAAEQKIRLIQAYQVNMVERQKCLWHSLRKESREDYTVYMGRSKMAYFSSGIVASSDEVIGLH